MMLFYFYLLNGGPLSGVVLAFHLLNGAYLYVVCLLGFQLADGLLYRLAGFHGYGLCLLELLAGAVGHSVGSGAADLLIGNGHFFLAGFQLEAFT